MKKVRASTRSRPVSLAEERARLAIDAAELGVYEKDLRTNTMVANRRLQEIFGLHHKKLIPFDYPSAIHPEDLPIRNSAYAESMITGYLAYEVRVIWPDKSIHWVKTTGKVIYENDEPVTLLGVIQDITEQKEFEGKLARQVQDKTRDLQLANQELQHINAELEQYVHVSSHDLQEPLRKIRIYSEMILTRDHDQLTESAKTHFAKINAAAERLSRSLKDLLNFNSVNKEDRYESVDLNEIIKMAENDLELVIAQKNASITYVHMPAIRAIPVQMHQLFYNLLNNALKFSKSENPPQIEIRTNIISSQNAQQYHYLDGSKKYVEIVVKDNGVGFEQSNAEKIFNMFQRLHDRRVFSGTGIGLALCKKVVQNHGGRIWASSAPGKGATFHVILPRN